MKKIYLMIALAAAMLNLTFQKSEAQQTILETFEVSADVPYWINANQEAPQPEIVANPDKSGLNPSDSVLLWVKAKGAPVYSAAMTELQAYDIQFTGSSTFIHVKMMKDNTDVCALQVIRTDDGMEENGKYLDPPIRIPCPTPNEWVDYVFDFSAPEATGFTWSRLYFMAVMNSTEPDNWTARELENDVNVYIDEIIIDSEANPYTSPITTVYIDKEGMVSYILNNPVTSELILNGIGEVKNITLYDIGGREVRNIRINNQDDYRLPVSDLETGIYLVKFVKANGKVDVSKIIKR